MIRVKDFFRIDLFLVFSILVLMCIGLAVISSTTAYACGGDLITPFVKKQFQRYLLSWVLFFTFASIDYRKLKDWAWIIYGFTLLALVIVLCISPIHNVHRWIRIPIIGLTIQPSEYAKIALILVLGRFLENKGKGVSSFSTAIQTFMICIIPFLLIAKQPDLGTALILLPISLGICFVASVHTKTIKAVIGIFIAFLTLITFIFLGVFPHDKMKPIFTKVLKEYQYQRLNADNYHQNASKTAIAIGGIFGSGWHKSEFSSKKWLPEAHTDSVFAAYAEEFGLFGTSILLFIYYFLVKRCIQISSMAKDLFGKLLASGIAIYLVMHILINIAMMCGVMPITGVPLIFITYGANSVLVTMIALGILQSIYSRRFMF